eukprot:gnl/TRDRNA2_/TRDRNA2_35013_c0_seq1.p1 gnl/TRDRNA2_/TRDRNA2_35013_c0~~gnl/TRDRNA2_/TRDRNA2_35013_c0_seq1.p1  ORF type:complete len:202 (+),score=17.87 gnl/TRDRNA2_/TRDRNA2_35013_c0_seq1:63-608(+)
MVTIPCRGAMLSLLVVTSAVIPFGDAQSVSLSVTTKQVGNLNNGLATRCMQMINSSLQTTQFCDVAPACAALGSDLNLKFLMLALQSGAPDAGPALPHLHMNQLLTGAELSLFIGYTVCDTAYGSCGCSSSTVEDLHVGACVNISGPPSGINCTGQVFNVCYHGACSKRADGRGINETLVV